MIIYLQLFWVFFKIGLLGFGGGYAMLSLIQYEVVVHYGWIDAGSFADMVAISQMTPGPIGINSATYVGYLASGNVVGSLVATCAVVLPSFMLLYLITKFLVRFKESRWMEDVMRWLRPAAIGFIAAAALLLMNKDNFFDYSSWIIFGVAFLASWRLKVHPILLLVIAALVGVIVY